MSAKAAKQVQPDEKKEKSAVDVWVEQTINALIYKMERVRLRQNLTHIEFSEQLGLKGKYSYTSIRTRRLTPSLDTMLRFLYLYGYDLNTLRKNSVERDELDEAVFEVAAGLSAFSAHDLATLARAVSELNDTEFITRRRVSKAISRLSKVVEKFEGGDELVDRQADPAPLIGDDE